MWRGPARKTGRVRWSSKLPPAADDQFLLRYGITFGPGDQRALLGAPGLTTTVGARMSKGHRYERSKGRKKKTPRCIHQRGTPTHPNTTRSARFPKRQHDGIGGQKAKADPRDVAGPILETSSLAMGSGHIRSSYRIRMHESEEALKSKSKSGTQT